MITSILFVWLIFDAHVSYVAGADCQDANGADTCDVKRMKKECPCKYSGSEEFKAYKTVGKCLHVSFEEATWQDAQENCKTLGGKLYEANDRIELLSARKLPLREDFWIGLNDVEKEGEWRWQLGSSSAAILDKYPSIYVRYPAVRQTFAPWQSGQPDNNGDRNCVVMDNNGQWRVESCSTKLPSICQIVSGHKPSPPVLTVDWKKANHTLTGGHGSTFTARCSGFVDAGTELVIEAATAPPGLTRNISSEDTNTENFALDPNQKCSRCGVAWTKSIQSAAVTVALYHSRLRCCTRRKRAEDQEGTPSRPTCKRYDTCAYSPIINIEYPTDVPDIDAGFELDKGQAYVDKVMNGSCRGAVGLGGSMTLEFMGGEWETIANYYVYDVQSKGDNIDRITVERKPDILDEERGPLIYLLFNLNVTKAMSGMKLACSTRAVPGSWVFQKAFSFAIRPICKMPWAPAVKVDPYKRPNILYNKRQLRFTCVAFLDDTNDIVIKVSSPITNIEYKFGSKVIIFTEDPDFNKDAVCGRKVVATLNRTISEVLDDATFECCARLANSKQKCHRTEPFRATYASFRPKLTYDTTTSNDKISAYCDAVVGAPEGVLSWRVISKNDKEVWTVDTQGNVVGRLADGVVNISSTLSQVEGQGYEIQSKLELTAESEGDLDSVVVTCAAYDILHATRLWLDLQETYSDGTIFEPKPPELDVKYYKDYEDTVALSQQLKASCEAWVGTGGSLTWVLQLKDGKKKGEDYRVAIGPRGLRDEEIQIEGAQVSYDSNKTNDVEGPYIASDISIKVTKAMAGALLMCYSYDARSHSIFLANEHDIFWRSSYPLNVMAFPTKPQLEVFYHNRPNIAYNLEQLEARCSAGVGQNGILTWVYISNTTETSIWPINALGDVLARTPSHVSISLDKAVDADDIGPMIESTIHILVLPDLAGATLACYSYDVPADDFVFDEGDELASRSLEFYLMNAPAKAASHSASETQVQVSSIAMLLLLVAILFLGVSLMRMKKPGGGRRQEGEDRVEARVSSFQASHVSKQTSHSVELDGPSSNQAGPSSNQASNDSRSQQDPSF